MKIREMALSTYYHQYVVMEADALTEMCRYKTDVSEEDCFALCSSFCNQHGLLMFDVLGIGPSADHCFKGMERDDVLGILTMDMAADCEAAAVDVDEDTKRRNEAFIALAERNTDEDLTAARMDWRLDYIRDLYYPDRILVGVIGKETIHEYNACVKSICGPFLECILEEDTLCSMKAGEVLYALPYMDGDGRHCRFYAMFHGNNMKDEEREAFERIMHVSDKYGITFTGMRMKS